MDPKPPQLQDENPPKIPSNPTQNHIRFSNTTTADKCNFDPFHQRRRKLERFMDTFRTVVIKIASSGGPLTAARQMLIEERLRDFFTDFHTPDHPTYSAMINRAIRDLNEEGGSSEESISEFIRKQFDDLPWAHSTLLKHHLRKLCECGDSR
ncbi:hypothetical protein F0562_032614 [Nyssa sinensis]|uniref:H15 domain-containing protein n=1 Tax=Nyssa sinensis TaxID=561372 RepID=A0A5J5APH7_9ASTE|nr:hypothetical protein F0562_032614 [Nyssa sinensis]